MLLYRLFTNQRQMHQATVRNRARLLGSDAKPNPSPSPSRSRSPSPSTSSQPLSLCGSRSPGPDGQEFFDALARDVTASKKRKLAESVLGIASPNPFELEVPANARLMYHVYVKDKTDGSDLAPPRTYRHTDSMITRGAFSCLKSCFETVEQVPIIEIQTPFGRRTITSEEEWEHAVLTIYNVRRAGGVVEVDVFV